MKELLLNVDPTLRAELKANTDCINRFMLIGRLEEALYELTFVKINFTNVVAQCYRLVLHHYTCKLKKKIVMTPMSECGQYEDITTEMIVDILTLCDEMREQNGAG